MGYIRLKRVEFLIFERFSAVAFLVIEFCQYVGLCGVLKYSTIRMITSQCVVVKGFLILKRINHVILGHVLSLYLPVQHRISVNVFVDHVFAPKVNGAM